MLKLWHLQPEMLPGTTPAGASHRDKKSFRHLGATNEEKEGLGHRPRLLGHYPPLRRHFSLTYPSPGWPDGRPTVHTLRMLAHVLDSG